MKRSKHFVLRALFVGVLLAYWGLPVSAQTGLNYLPQNNEVLTGHGLGGFMPNLKENAVNVVDVNQNVLALHGVQDPQNPDRYLHVMLTEPISGNWLWSYTFDRPGQDIDPGAICESPGNGYGVVGYDYGNLLTYVFFLDYNGNLQWVQEIGDVVGKNIFAVAAGVTGDPEFVVTGENGGVDLYAGHFEIFNSGNPVYEYVQDNGGAIPNLGYCASDLPNSGNGYYRNISTDGANRFYVSAYSHQGVYQYTVRNTMVGLTHVNPLWLDESTNSSGLLVTSGTASDNGGATWHAFVSVMNDHGESLWASYLPAVPGSSFESALFNSSTGLIVVAGYTTGSSGERYSIVGQYDLSGNLIDLNYYFPYFTQADDIFSGIAELPAINGMVAGGFVYDPNVINAGLATRFTMTNSGKTDCYDPALPPAHDITTPWIHLINPPNQVGLAGQDGMNDNQFNLEVLRCGLNKNSPRSAADELATGHLTVFPQPARQSLNLRLEGDQIQAYRLVSLEGKVMAEMQFDQLVTERTIDVSEFAAGFYFLQVEGETNSWNQKVVVQ